MTDSTYQRDQKFFYTQKIKSKFLALKFLKTIKETVYTLKVWPLFLFMVGKPFLNMSNPKMFDQRR